MTLKERLDGKRVLFIPIFSMRDYQTGIYNLDNDGNFARIQSLIEDANLKAALVTIPRNASLHRKLSNKWNFIMFPYGENARATRLAKVDVESILRCVNSYNIDYVISEPNVLTAELAERIPEKLIYWCVASVTSEGTPWFVEDFVESDKALAQKVVTACANNAQVEALGGLAYYEPSFYDPKLFDYKTIFFPFRLTDSNYHAKEFLNAIYELSKRDDVPPFKALYTDVNNSELFSSNVAMHKISADHDTYLQVLKGRPIIPYLERDDVLEHISIHEFMYYNCELIMLSQRHKRDYPNITYINSTDELLEALVNSLRRTTK